MRLVAYLQDERFLSVFHKAKIKDVILAPKKLARLGKLSYDKTQELALKAKKRNLRPILLWDILMSENVFKGAVDYLESLDMENFHAIRLQDPGAFHFVKRKFPQMKIQLMVERGNHNLEALLSWCRMGGENLERLVLSQEFDKEAIIHLLAKLPVSIELLGLGPILLYHSPRSLLAKEFEKQEDHFIDVQASSEEIPLKKFSLIENEQGTFMFYPKDYCLLEYLDELRKMEVDFFRLDIPLDDHHLYFLIADLMENFSEEKVSIIKKRYKKEVIRGFYSVNRSDSLFFKLKNPHIRPSGNFLGEVVEVKKKNYLALILKNKQYSLKPGDDLLFKTPDGKEKRKKILQMRNSSGQKIFQAFAEDLVLLDPIGGISIKTAVYRD